MRRNVAKRISRYESGLITVPEWANSLLHDLVSGPELDTTFVSFLDSLPHEVGQEFRRLMAKDRAGRFPLDSFFLTSSTARRDPTEFSAQLRRVSALLRQDRVNGEAQRPAEPGSRDAVGAGKTSGTVPIPIERDRWRGRHPGVVG